MPTNVRPAFHLVTERGSIKEELVDHESWKEKGRTQVGKDKCV